MKKDIAKWSDILKQRLKQRSGYMIFTFLIFSCFLLFIGEKVDYPMKLSLIALLIGNFIIFFSDEKLHRTAFMLIFGFGVLFSFTTPIFEIPDEPAHFLRSLYTANGNLALSEEDNNLLVDKSYDILYSESGKNLYQNNLMDFKQDKDLREETDLRASNAYAFISYIPQAFGIILGKILNSNLFGLFYYGRIFNVLIYAIFISLAIKITPVFKNFIFVVATIPMAIFIAGSYNQDAFSIGLILVTISYFLFLSNKDKGKIKIKEIIVYTILCLIISFSKVPYVLLICMLIFIKSDKFEKKKSYYLCFVSVFLVAIVTLIWIVIYSKIPFDGISASVDLKEQIKFILNAPLDNIRMIIHEVLVGITTFNTVFLFGRLTYGAFEMTSMLYVFFLGSIAVFFPREKIQDKRTRVGAVLIMLGIYAGIFLSLYLTWTPVGVEQILGVQGRYFIPLLPLFPVLMNIGIQKSELNKVTWDKYNLLTVSISVYFILMTFAETLNEYY